MPVHDQHSLCMCTIAVCRMCMVWLHISVNMEEVSQLGTSHYYTMIHLHCLQQRAVIKSVPQCLYGTKPIIILNYQKRLAMGAESS